MMLRRKYGISDTTTNEEILSRVPISELIKNVPISDKY
jgi:hypothetical protein